MGKSNQVVPPAPQLPVPAVGVPFEHVTVDCVGLLPRTRSRYVFLLTMMCVSTRFLEAVPLRRITTAGPPKVVETN